MNLFTRIFKSLSNLAHYLGGLLLAANGLVYLNRSISISKTDGPRAPRPISEETTSRYSFQRGKLGENNYNL